MDAARTMLTGGCKRIAAFVPPILGAVWIAAAWAKIVHPDESIAAIRAALAEFGVGVPAGTRWVLVGVIATELFLGFGLIFTVSPRALLVVSAAALAALTAWLGFLAARNPETPCGCGLRVGWWEGGSSAETSLVRNLVLLVVHAGVLVCLLPMHWRARTNPVSIG